MTVQYPYPVQPGYPVQQAPTPQYPVPPQQFQAPQYPQPGYPPVQPPAPQVPLATGSIDEFYAQPSTGGGPSISWKDKPIGTVYGGAVARNVTSADIQQQTNFNTKQPEFYRDGRPKFVMKVPLRVQPTQEFPEGEATLFVRGRMRDELVRAMTAVGLPAGYVPQEGDFIVVQLSGKKPSGQGMNPANEFLIQYTPADAGGTGAPSPAPVQVPAAPAPPQVQQYGAPAPAASVQQAAPATPQVQPPAQPQPQFQAPPTSAMPEGFSPEQQALLARLTGQAPA